MLFYRVALFVLAFNLTLSFVTNIPINAMGNDLDNNPFGLAQDNSYNITARVDNGWNASAPNLGINNLGFGDIPGSFIMLVKVIGDCTITMNVMLEDLGLPSSLALIFAGLTNLTYVIAGVQIWSGRSIEN